MNRKRSERPVNDLDGTAQDLDSEAIDAIVAEELEEEEPTQPWGTVATWVRRLSIMILFPAFSIFYLVESLTISLPNRDLPVSPRGFPTAVAVAMVLVSVTVAILELVRLFRHRQAKAAGFGFGDPEDDDRERITYWPDAWAMLVALTVYIAVFAWLGFAISTFLFMFGVSSYYQPRKWLTNIVVSVLFSTLVYALFAFLLGVQLPEGILKGVF